MDVYLAAHRCCMEAPAFEGIVQRTRSSQSSLKKMEEHHEDQTKVQDESRLIR